MLWLQEQEVRRRLPLHKILGALNPADLMTKNLNKQDIEKYIDKLGICFKECRSDIAPGLHALQVASELCSSELSDCEKKVKNIPRGHQGKGVRDKWHVADDVVVLIGDHGGNCSRHWMSRPMMSRTLHYKGIRATRGIYEDGASFRMTDSWTNPSRAHHVTTKPWTGVSVCVAMPCGPGSLKEHGPRGSVKHVTPCMATCTRIPEAICALRHSRK